MTPSIRRVFILVLMLPLVASLLIVLIPMFRSGNLIPGALLYVLPSLLWLAAILTAPSGIFYLAAVIARRRWITFVGMAISIVFALLFGILALVKGGGMAFPVVAACEATLAVLMLMLAGIMRMKDRFSHSFQQLEQSGA